MWTRAVLFALLASGCALDVSDETTATESEIQYCPDGELCDPFEPPPTTTTTIARPDLVAAPPTSPCHFVYTDIPRPGYKLGVRVSNIGTAHVGASTARVRFVVSYTGFVTAPLDITIPGLDAGAATTQYFAANAYCWNSLPGCDIQITADASNMYAEKSEGNNATTWHCSKP